MVYAAINPKTLKWAFKRSKDSEEIIAKSTNIKLEKLKAWFVGDSQPTFKQAQKLAKVLRVPFGYFFLSAPPIENLSIPDLRTVKNHAFENPSPNFIDLLSEVLRKKDWYREYLLEGKTKPLSFIGKFNVKDDIELVAEDIAEKFVINNSFRDTATGWENFLSKLIHVIQENGILVLRSGVVGNLIRRTLQVNEFRGFAVADDIAPVIFINSNDAKSAQIFTLIHEVAHLWIGESGISNLDLSCSTSDAELKIERFCNKVAAEVLVPKDLFFSNWSDANDVEVNIKRLVVKCKVSKLVILRRAYDLQKMNYEFFVSMFKSELIESERRRLKLKENSDSGNFYNTFFARHSDHFASAVITAVNDGRVQHREAASLLGVKVPTLERIANQLGQN